MSAKIKYSNEDIGAPLVAKDFLPHPSELVPRDEGVKVTLALSKKSVAFFKTEASRHHTQYQRMIRKLLDAYVDSYMNSSIVKAPSPSKTTAPKKHAKASTH